MMKGMGIKMLSNYKKAGFILLTAAAATAAAFAIFNPGIKTITDVSYGKADAQKVDIYLPRAHKSKCTAVVIYIHGGAWSGGDKSGYDTACKSEAKNGYAAATINYRMIGEGATWEDMLEDITAAIETVKTTAAQNGITLSKAALTGGSAGAHLAMLYSYKNQDISPIKIAFCGEQCGPSNLLDMDVAENSGDPDWTYSILSGLIGQELNKMTFGAATDVLRAASPVTYITKDSPPTIIAHGQKDDVVLYSQGLDVHNAFTAVGVACELITFPNSGHGLDSDPESSERYKLLFAEYETKYFGY